MTKVILPAWTVNGAVVVADGVDVVDLVVADEADEGAVVGDDDDAVAAAVLGADVSVVDVLVAIEADCVWLYEDCAGDRMRVNGSWGNQLIQAPGCSQIQLRSCRVLRRSLWEEMGLV